MNDTGRMRLGETLGDLAAVVENTRKRQRASIEKLSKRFTIHELHGNGTTIVFSSHNLQSSMQLADRVAVLVEGQLVKLEETPAPQAALTRGTTIRAMQRAGEAIEEVHTDAPDWEALIRRHFAGRGAAM